MIQPSVAAELTCSQSRNAGAEEAWDGQRRLYVEAMFVPGRMPPERIRAVLRRLLAEVPRLAAG